LETSSLSCIPKVVRNRFDDQTEASRSYIIELSLFWFGNASFVGVTEIGSFHARDPYLSSLEWGKEWVGAREAADRTATNAALHCTRACSDSLTTAASTADASTAIGIKHVYSWLSTASTRQAAAWKRSRAGRCWRFIEVVHHNVVVNTMLVHTFAATAEGPCEVCLDSVFVNSCIRPFVHFWTNTVGTTIAIPYEATANATVWMDFGFNYHSSPERKKVFGRSEDLPIGIQFCWVDAASPEGHCSNC
jgi:hypothetical protein